MEIYGFLKKKGVTLSLKEYFITALSFMAFGLFSSLIIGLMMKTIGELCHFELFTEMGLFAMKAEITGAAIGVAIAYGLKAPSLVLFSSVFVGAIGYQMGGAVGSYIAAVCAVEIGKIVYKTTSLDIILTPLCVIMTGFLVSRFVGVYINEVMLGIGHVINLGTEREPFVMSMIVAVLMGWALTAPISSVAIAYMLGLDGLAAGASVIGCAAQMVGFAVISYRDNGLGGSIAQGIGTSMLQIPNIIKNPLIIIPPTIAGLVVAPIAIVLFGISNNTAGAGMGTSGLVGPIMAFQVNTEKGIPMTTTSLQILFFYILLPALISFFVWKIMVKKGWIKAGDLHISYE